MMFAYKKLIKGTHHDQIGFLKNPHKILGYSALFHYMYRYYRFFTTGHMFDYKPYEVIFILWHVILSCSSFLFPIRSDRNYKNQIIWRELQLHNIVFTTRSAMIMLFHIFSVQDPILTFPLVMVHHIGADIVTYYYKDGTTMRKMAWDEQDSLYTAKPVFDRFYAIAQFGATTFLTYGTSHQMEFAFSVMFAIQISTFLMTLRLKGIIGNNLWHILYSLSLFLTFVVGWEVSNSNYLKNFYLAFFVWRTILRQDKYLGWILLFFTNTFIETSVDH